MSHVRHFVSAETISNLRVLTSTIVLSGGIGEILVDGVFQSKMGMSHLRHRGRNYSYAKTNIGWGQNG